jgi:hypothetical protein
LAVLLPKLPKALNPKFPTIRWVKLLLVLRRPKQQSLAQKRLPH